MTTPPPVFGRQVHRVHLLGAGGMGMTPLGLYLAQRGFAVTAEDDAWNPATRELLVKAGVQLTATHTLPSTTELVVFSSAVAASHPTRTQAAARGIAMVRRGEMLAEVVRDRKLVAIVGSHGKTTTTAMLVTALVRGGVDCGWVLGGLFHDDALPPARDVPGWIVAEVDESDGTIGRFAPEITVAVNLDWDHADHYRTLLELQDEFAALFARTKQALFMSDACPVVTGSARNATPVPHGQGGQKSAQVYTFGRTGDFASRVVHEGGGLQRLALDGRFTLREASVRALGEFNAANATAALAVAQHLGARLEASTLAEFAGVRRRQTCLHASRHITVYEDYAHHPTEIRALLASLRRSATAGRLVAVFQPHRYTRTAQFKAEFAAALAAADLVFLLDVYAASESPVPGGTTADVYAEFRKAGATVPVTYLPGDRAGLRAALQRALKSGDTLAFIGAGDIDKFGRDFVEELRDRERRDAAWMEFIAAVRPKLAPTTKLTEQEPLAAKTTLRVGGPARVYAEPAGEAELQALLQAAHARQLPVFVLGRGSNLLIPDEGVDGLVLSLGHAAWQVFEPQADGRVWAGAGLRLKNLCGLAAKAGLSGFEFMEGIPASLGGALRMNAGAMGGWTFDVVDEVHLLTLAGEKRVMKREQMHYDYRHCAELEQAVAIGAFLRPAAAADSAGIKQQIEAYQRKRQESQPREPSAGCIFKNPPGNSAGRVIDESGLKGERVGDAEVSPVHANFIVNRGHATSADIIELVRRVRARVKAARGIDLQPEVMLFGKDWRDVL